MSYINKGSMPATVTVSVEPDRSGNFVCDGTADQVEILVAIAYMVALYGGGTVHVKAGNYDIAASIAITDDAVLLEGEGDGTILTLSADIDGITFTGAGVWPNVLKRGGVVDLKIVGFGAGHTNNGISLTYSDWVYINNVHLEECYDCLFETGGGNNIVTDNHLTLFYRYGIFFYGAENIIADNSIDVSQDGATHRGINLPGGGNVVVGNVVEQILGTAGDGLNADGNGNIIVGNTFRECARYGVNLNGDRNLFVGNHLQSNISQQMIIYGDDNLVDGNFFYDGGVYGIYFSGSSTGNRIGINYFTGNSSGPVRDANEQKYQSQVFPFVEGGNAAGIQTAQFIHADASAKGWEIDAADEWAIALGHMPLNVFQVVKIKIWAVGLAAPGAATEMWANFIINAGGSDEPYTTEAIAVNNKPTEETNFAINDVIHWDLKAADDTDIDEIAGGDSVEVKVNYDPGENGDIATDAIFRAVEFEYV